MLQFKLGDIPFSLPSSWSEVTVGKFKKIINPKVVGDLTEIISTLSGLDYDLLNKTVRPMNENIMMVEAVGWAKDLPDWFNTPMPKEFSIAGKPIDLNKNVEQYSFGQYATFVSLASINPMVWKDKTYINVNCIDKAIAIYCYPDFSGEEFSDKWQSLLPVIDDMPFLQCFAVATFFLNKFKDLHKPTQKEQKAKQPQKKSKPVAKSLQPSVS